MSIRNTILCKHSAGFLESFCEAKKQNSNMYIYIYIYIFKYTFLLDVSPKALMNFPSLLRLDLSRNHLTGLDPRTSMPVKLLEVDLRGELSSLVESWTLNWKISLPWSCTKLKKKTFNFVNLSLVQGWKVGKIMFLNAENTNINTNII